MEVKNNVLTAFLQTDNAQARELLTQQLTELRNILEGQGVQVGRLDVQLRLEPGEANAENPDPQDDPGRRSADDPRQEQPSNETEADEVPIDDLEEPLEQDWAQGQGVDLALDRIA
jgi:flagellar hook-length control protein FliK